MSDDSLDRRVAEIVGWTRASAHDPTGCIEDAIAALEAMREKGWAWRIYSPAIPPVVHTGYTVLLDGPEDRQATGTADLLSLPLAICRAIVAVEGK